MAAAADTLTPLTFELGGKSANIVFPDADLSAVALISSVTVHQTIAGQGCAVATRLVVDRERERRRSRVERHRIAPAEAVFIEDLASGTQLLQELRAGGGLEGSAGVNTANT